MSNIRSTSSNTTYVTRFRFVTLPAKKCYFNVKYLVIHATHIYHIFYRTSLVMKLHGEGKIYTVHYYLLISMLFCFIHIISLVLIIIIKTVNKICLTYRFH